MIFSKTPIQHPHPTLGIHYTLHKKLKSQTKLSINFLNEYIQQYRIGPPTLALYNKCIERYSIKLKKLEGNILSYLHSMSAMLASSCLKPCIFRVINQILLKNILILIKGFKILSCNTQNITINKD